MTGPRVLLRPFRPGELTGSERPESPFDDFGPRNRLVGDPPSSLDADGRLAVVAESELCGEVSWHWTQWGPNAASRCVMVGILLDTAARGQGIGPKALAKLTELFFSHTTVNRVEAHTDVENRSAQRALEKAGFSREGVVRGAQWRAGAYRDGVLFSCLRDDAL